MKSLNKIAIIFLISVPITFARLAILGKIWNLTMVQHLNAPSLTMFQMFALTWFLGAATYHPHDSEGIETIQAFARAIGSLATILFSWGLAALIF